MSRKGVEGGASASSLWQQFELSTTSFLRAGWGTCPRRHRHEDEEEDRGGAVSTLWHVPRHVHIMAPGVVETETTRTTPTTRVPLWAYVAEGLQASGTEGTPRVQFRHGRARGHQSLVSLCSTLWEGWEDAKREDRRRGRTVLRQMFCSWPQHDRPRWPRSTVSHNTHKPRVVIATAAPMPSSSLISQHRSGTARGRRCSALTTDRFFWPFRTRCLVLPIYTHGPAAGAPCRSFPTPVPFRNIEQLSSASWLVKQQSLCV